VYDSQKINCPTKLPLHLFKKIPSWLLQACHGFNGYFLNSPLLNGSNGSDSFSTDSIDVLSPASDSNTGIVVKIDKQRLSKGSAAAKGNITPGRAQRLTPAIMNAMALSYQTHFEDFCKGT
jgi:hypothetical protein